MSLPGKNNKTPSKYKNIFNKQKNKTLQIYEIF